MKTIFYFLIFPGFLFTVTVGLFTSWLHRKITAKFQSRIGPPWYQEFMDLFRISRKDTVFFKDDLSYLFLLAPAAGLVAVIIASSMLWMAVIAPQKAFVGDLIVILYLLNIPVISLMMGGLALRSPFSWLGVWRHAELLMVHELPFILSILVPVILSGGIIKTTDLIQFQQTNFIFLRHPSIIFSFLAAVVCTQAKLMLSPFDVQAQEADISGSVYTEYSGIGLATYRLTSMASLFVMPFFLTLVFLSGITLNGVANILLLILKIFVVILLTIVIKNKTLRFKPKQAARFFLGPMTAVGIIAVLLAFLGL